MKEPTQMHAKHIARDAADHPDLLRKAGRAERKARLRAATTKEKKIVAGRRKRDTARRVAGVGLEKVEKSTGGKTA